MTCQKSGGYLVNVFEYQDQDGREFVRLSVSDEDENQKLSLS